MAFNSETKKEVSKSRVANPNKSRFEVNTYTVGGLLSLKDQFDDIIEGQELLALLLLLAQAHADLLGDVVAKSVDDVSEEVHVQDTLAIPIVDVADFLNSCIKTEGSKVLLQPCHCYPNLTLTC